MTLAKVSNFIEKLAPAAIEIGAKYGLDPNLILSQSALETGWGEKVAGNNYFGVKSHGKPGGQTVSTHEEVNGKLVPVNDSFRAYDTLYGSMEDYAKFLRDNPRYSDVFNQTTADGQIKAVADAGYATSSKYLPTLRAVSKMIDLTPYQNGDAMQAINKMVPGAQPQTNALAYAPTAKAPQLCEHRKSPAITCLPLSAAASTTLSALFRATPTPS
ncbi:glucosaminidase domain-containing protein [Devosia algicola]|uniref:Glucosaminidase domain-containing protein n=1 Tax=Devosia algicola TaxID=3026418 RepID=A0ABY7YQL5_9HYPH|nr:glucosaminidase domain-containing protein [Devosia algicola]WDR03618.1 glucosaminidase domain-containing protein [Devosia algicola]